jgi:hypothetical protein
MPKYFLLSQTGQMRKDKEQSADSVGNLLRGRKVVELLIHQ